MGEQDTPTFDARFIPSDWLRNLQQRRKQVRDNATRKSLTFKIRRLHRKEFKQWKAAYSGIFGTPGTLERIAKYVLVY